MWRKQPGNEEAYSTGDDEVDSERGIDLESDNDDDAASEGFYVGGDFPGNAASPSASADGTQTLTLDEVRRRRLERFSK